MPLSIGDAEGAGAAGSGVGMGAGSAAGAAAGATAVSAAGVGLRLQAVANSVVDNARESIKMLFVFMVNLQWQDERDTASLQGIAGPVIARRRLGGCVVALRKVAAGE